MSESKFSTDKRTETDDNTGAEPEQKVSVFISCLGTTNYHELEYTPLDKGLGERSCKTRFIQLARLKALKDRNVKLDGAYILVTKGKRGSEQKNWLDNGHGDAPVDGLESSLEKNEISGVKAISIPDGSSESEMWGIFSQITDLIPQQADVFVDLTHGFRTLPVILLLALEYVEKVKGAKIVELTYGASPPEAGDLAPTWDLEPFLVIRQWAAAAESFVRYGDTRPLAGCAQTPTKTLKKSLQKDMPKELYVLPKALEEFGEHISKCFSPGIPDSAAKLRSLLDKAIEESAKHDRLKPLAAILEEVEKKLDSFPTDVSSEINRLKAQWAAAKWCCDHHRAMQGLTFLREGFVECLELGIRGRDKIEGKADQLIGYLARYKSDAELENDAKEQVDELLQVPPFAKEAWDKFLDIVSSLTLLRNKLNHGYRGHGEKSPISNEHLRSQSSRFLEALKLAIDSIETELLQNNECSR